MKTSQMTCKPFVKWAGGKQALAAQLVQFFPAFSGRYFEPFLGGGSVFLTAQPSQAVLGDLNTWLVDTYRAVASNWTQVAEILDGLVNTRENYLEIRSVHPDDLPSLEHRAAHLIYLNKTCFRGLFRVNRKGRFNVPYGEYSRRYYNPNNLQAVSQVLGGAIIKAASFEETVKGATSGDFVYFDPPYYKVGGYSDFNRYTSEQFREADQIRLRDLCRQLNDRGVLWAVSNSNTEFIRGLYGDFTITEVAARREINLNSKSRNITELVVTNYKPDVSVDVGLFG